MGMIGINEMLFPMAVTTMTFTGNAINGVISSWVSQGEKSTAFSSFLEDYRIMQIILCQYRQLVLRDIGTINKVGAEISKIDDVLLTLWR